MRIGLTGEATAQAGDITLSLAMTNRAWMAAEQAAGGRNYLLLLLDLATAEAAKEPPPASLMSAILYGATRRDHPQLTQDDCIDLMVEFPDIAVPLSEAIAGSIKLEDRDQGEAKAPAAAQKSRRGTGTKR